jgi:hypothetical protein
LGEVCNSTSIVGELSFFEASLKEIDQLTEHALSFCGGTFGTHHKL